MPKILLIDDDAELCDELSEIFREEGYLVDNAFDSGEGAGLIKSNRYDVGIFDYKMSGLNGIDLLKMIKGVSRQCAVFIVSGRPGIEKLIKEEHVSDLVAGVINKPFDIDDILQKVRAVSAR
jgi:DNA-binding response OmpR family regulator